MKTRTGIASLIIGPPHDERQRRIILGQSMIAVHGRVHAKARWCISSPQLIDTSAQFAGVGECEQLPSCRMGAETSSNKAVTERTVGPATEGTRAGHIYVPDRHIDKSN